MSKVCVVTGGSLGIGAATVAKFEQQGLVTYNLDIQKSDHPHSIQCDVTDKSSLQNAIDQIVEQHGRIDVLVCNAGVHFSGNVLTTPDEQFDRVFDINVRGVVHALQAVIPVMQKHSSGAIVMVASDQSHIAKGNSFAYNMSKHAVASITKTTAIDFAQDGIRCNAVCPGTIDTPLYRNAINAYCERSGEKFEDVDKEHALMQPIGRLGTSEEVASLIAFLASDEAGFITGSLHNIDGGYTTV